MFTQKQGKLLDLLWWPFVGSEPFKLTEYKKYESDTTDEWSNSPSLEGNSLIWGVLYFLNKLGKPYLPKGYMFHLPTEEQWEYACRAGTNTALNNGKNLTCKTGKCENLDEVAWYRGNTNNKKFLFGLPVGKKKPNAWGIYDMHGNVWEWTRTLAKGDLECNRGILTYYVIKGGNYESEPKYCRSAYSGKCRSLKTNGYRLALVPIEKQLVYPKFEDIFDVKSMPDS